MACRQSRVGSGESKHLRCTLFEAVLDIEQRDDKICRRDDLWSATASDGKSKKARFALGPFVEQNLETWATPH